FSAVRESVTAVFTHHETKELTMSWFLRSWFKGLGFRGGEGGKQCFRHDLASRRQRPRSRPSGRLFLEPLEDRTVPSTITWTNRGQASDNFGAVFGANANLARGVVDAAINEWTSLVTNFNQPGGGNNINVNISMQSGGYGGVTRITNDNNGWPPAANIALRDGNDPGKTYFFYPNPHKASEFHGTIATTVFGFRPAGEPGRRQDRSVHDCGTRTVSRPGLRRRHTLADNGLRDEYRRPRHPGAAGARLPLGIPRAEHHPPDHQ